MKTAVAIPDDVFRAAESLAREEGLSRSALYAKAVRRYLADCERDPVTLQLNRVYDDAASKLDPIVTQIAVHSLPKEDW